MSWYRDLQRCDYFRLEDTTKLHAVGWLERGHEFTNGHVDDETLSILVELAADPWQPLLLLGWHDCSLCEVPDGPETFHLGGKSVQIGASNLFVPHPSGVFVAPTMILHYVAAHGYRPPVRFVEAVKRCPLMGSPEYLEALRLSGGAGVVQHARR